MKSTIHLKSISELHKMLQKNALKHPLISFIEFEETPIRFNDDTKITTDFYTVIFKTQCIETVKYGRQTIDFQEGNIICIAPNQVLEIEKKVAEKNIGWALFFHSDLIIGSSLYEKMERYTFFNYNIAEALHLSDKEKIMLYECVQKINTEIKENTDVYSQHIIVSSLELLLNYCSRFYGRQMITRTQPNKAIVSKIENILQSYFSINNEDQKDLPTVKYLAASVNLSPSYLSDLLKRETGKTAQDFIHFYLIEKAKNYLLSSEDGINEIAYKLGFEYPQYFNKLFKQKTGKTPMQFRNEN